MDSDVGQAAKRASDAGRALGKLGATKGGRARANALSPAERSEIARQAVRARWARSAVVKGGGTGEAGHPDGPLEEAIPRSMFRGQVDLGSVVVECHVLSDGTRVITRSGLMHVIGAAIQSGNPDRHLLRIPAMDEQLLIDRSIRFRTTGDADLTDGYEVGLLADVCELVLSARDAGLLKKKQMPLAAAAESIVRTCSRTGLVSLVDRDTGYGKVRSRQVLQLMLQAYVADEMDEWARILPAEFWAQLARLEGMRVVPDHPPIRWASYVMAFVYDAIEPDVGRELRREDSGATFAPSPHEWLLATSRRRLGSRMHQVVVAMNDCADIDEFRSTFAKVLLKRPLNLRWLGELG